jgi:hypothetical protein
VSPNVRRAMHQALDLVLDALAEEEREQPAPARKRRGQVTPEPIAMPVLAPEKLIELEAQLARQMGRAGYRKAG